jgi:hypothetical protein
MTGQQSALNNVSSALLVGLGVAAAGLFIFALLSRLATPWKALAWASTCLLFFWQWGAWSSYGTVASWIGSAALFALVLISIGKAAEHLLLRRVLFVSSITLTLTMLVLISVNHFGASPASVEFSSAEPADPAVRRPDVVFIALDAYAREDVLRDVYSYDNGPFLDELEAAGFEVSDSANSNYTSTHTSVTSMLNTSYLELADGTMDNSDLVALASAVSGDNEVVRTLKDYGYAYIHGSGDNWLNQCSGFVDVCLPGPAMDQTAFSLLTKTPIGPLLFPETGNPTTWLNLGRIDQLRNWRATVDPVGDAPYFAYFHLVLPHPPLYLDASCQPRVEQELGGQLMGGPGIPPGLAESRKAAYVEQLICANATLAAFIDQLDGDEIVVLASDHGPDSYGTLDSDPVTWTADQLRERLATLAAIRLPRGCENPGDENMQAVNMFRIVLGCIQGTELPLLQPEFHAATFSGPMVEVYDPDRGSA